MLKKKQGGCCTWHVVYLSRPVVVQVGKSHFVLCSDRAADDELVDVIELIPVLWKVPTD
jgi:hypothetical protein